MDWSISVGDILTVVSILISVFALRNAWIADRRSRNKAQADQVRNAAAQTLAKIERWREISLWFYDEIQPLFIEASEMLDRTFDENSDLIKVRDFLWKRLNEAHIEIGRRILDEEIEVAYVNLYGYQPEVYSLFSKTIEQLKAEDIQHFGEFLEAVQKGVMNFKTLSRDYHSAMMGNMLRSIGVDYRSDLEKKTDRILKPIHTFLITVIQKSDDEILNT